MTGWLRAPKLQGMSAVVHEPRPDRPPRCAACGDVIGVYEPVVHVAGRLVRETSRAAEPDACLAGAVCYHAACYASVSQVTG
jgi:hypothetical protein